MGGESDVVDVAVVVKNDVVAEKLIDVRWLMLLEFSANFAWQILFSNAKKIFCNSFNFGG